MFEIDGGGLLRTVSATARRHAEEIRTKADGMTVMECRILMESIALTWEMLASSHEALEKSRELLNKPTDIGGTHASTT